jgi:hypothetical protein
MPFLHQLMSQSSVQKHSLKPQTASNAGVEERITCVVATDSIDVIDIYA